MSSGARQRCCRALLFQRTINSLFGMKQNSRIHRRSFLKGLGLSVPAVVAVHRLAPAQAAETSSRPASLGKAHELAADLVIIGGGTGGCAAALAAARNGLRVILTEETDWIGGQLTAQAVPPDENAWIETHGGTRSYQDLRQRVRDYYRRNFPLTAAAKAVAHLNPGNGSVSRLCHEPRVSLAALYELLAPFIAGQTDRTSAAARAQVCRHQWRPRRGRAGPQPRVRPGGRAARAVSSWMRPKRASCCR